MCGHVAVGAVAEQLNVTVAELLRTPVEEEQRFTREETEDSSARR